MTEPFKLSKRAQNIQPFYVMDILAQAKSLERLGHDVVHLEVGEPDFETPESVRKAAITAIESGETFYTPACGLPELRQAISDYYLSEFKATVEASRIIITPGASGALQLALASLIEPGDGILMADPGYPCNRHFVQLLEGLPQSIPVDADSHYQLTAELIHQHWQTSTVAAMIATPSNPTGTCVDRQAMTQIVQQIRALKGSVLVDEIYQGLAYQSAEFTAADMGDNVFVINSFSKFFSMTGWRLGWLVVPETAISVVDRLAQNLFLAAPTISQHAALACFQPETLNIYHAQRDELKQRRDFLYEGLTALGFGLHVMPQGAFYLYADISAFSDDSFAFCEQLLDQAHVAITPGKDFGLHQQSRYVRFAYTQPIERLELALQRISTFLTSC